MGMFRKTLKRLRSLALVMVLATGQIAAATGPFINLSTAHAAPVCTVDTAGANDEPGQKDLTQLCVDYANVPSTVATTWNWDDTSTSGANTMDACNLFDTDGDGYVNYSVCVTTEDDPAVFKAVTTYSCGDDKIDRCTSPIGVVSSGTTECDVNQAATDPFEKGDSYPTDTEGSCTIQLSTVGGSSARLIDVCSYPSAEPNSDPSDCVIARPRAGKLEVKKDLIPATDSGKFNLQIDGTTQAADVGDEGTTGEVVVSAGNHSVGELAGTGTSLTGYTSSISCRDLNGTGSVVASGNVTSLASVPVADGSDIICVITNTASGSISIIKDAQPNSAQVFSFVATGTGVSNFSLDDDSNSTLSNTKTFNNLSSGDYTFSENTTNGWDFDNIACSQGASVQTTGASVTISLSGGQNVSCTFTNKQRGNIVVHKVTDPANDPTSFQITASGSGNIAGNATRSISTSQDVTYDVAQGTYAVTEQAASGWSETSNTCSNLVINASTPLVNGVPTLTCTITNTKLAKLKIIKDADPNSSQDFVFSTAGTGLTGFTLDDDSDPGLPNNVQFTDLAPGSYSVTETETATQTGTSNWDLTGMTCDSSYNAVNATISLTLSAGADVTCTFTNTQRGIISGTKNNVDADGSLVGTLSGWVIQLISNGQVVDQTTTDANGDYSFTNLIPGTYSLMEVLQTGWTQIYVPGTAGTVILDAGETDSGNDFGNFQNGSISGYKFNDHNGNATKDESDEKLSGWTMTLYNDGEDADVLLDDVVDSKVTDVNGNYSFTNLAPGTYQVCETQQTGWIQTYPSNNSCHLFVIDETGEQNTGNFGNQGRGHIKVIKNLDNDRDGRVDQTDVKDWTWDIDGSGDYATGSTQDVAAGNYIVSEDQKISYHVTASSCSGESTPQVPTTSLSVSVAPDETVICTFTNTRDNVELELLKTNNRPNPTETGDTVTYTLTVTVPEDSGIIYDACVTDLPPEGFRYVPDSWTADSNFDHDVASDVARANTEGDCGAEGGPTYGSPGQWFLGNLMPGEIVTLTYQALIGDSVSDGTYPDIAFATGCGLPQSSCESDETVFSNLALASDPFVSTEVTIGEPAVLGEAIVVNRSVLVNTGTPYLSAYLMLAALLTTTGLLVARRQNPTKGGRK